jgi:hypothetical protein
VGVLTALDPSTSIADGTTEGMFYIDVQARMKAVGDRFNHLVFQGNVVDWDACGPYELNTDAENHFVVKHQLQNVEVTVC